MRFNNINYIHLHLVLRASPVVALSLAMLLFLAGCFSQQKPKYSPDSLAYKKTGIASYYADKFQSRKTANGEVFDNNLMTAAHRTLPFGTHVLVKNVHNGKSVKVTINDRGPFVIGRIIDLSRAAFAKIEKLDKGITKVEVRVVDY